MGRITDNDANALSCIDFDTRVEILYEYLVNGYNMKDIAANVLDNYDDFASQTVSVVTRGYGFHEGRGRGRYRNVPREIIEDFVDQYQPEDYNGGLNEGTFDRFLEPYFQQQRQQAAWEKQRADEARRQQQAIDDARRQQEAIDKARRQQEADAAARRSRDYTSYVNQAKQAIRERRWQDAYNLLTKARACEDTWDLNALFAQVMASAGNADKWAADIIRELTELWTERQKKNQDLTADQHLWLARAYLAQGNKDRGCDHYFFAGDIYYDQAADTAKSDPDKARELYKKADALYTEGAEKSGYGFSSNSVQACFRRAFARAKAKESLTEEDYRFCAECYRRAIERGEQTEYAYGNRAIYLRLLKKYGEAIMAAQRALDLGNHEEYVYNNLLMALVADWDNEEALETMAEMDRRGYSYSSLYKGLCLRRTGKKAQSIPHLEAYLIRDPNHVEALQDLAWAYLDTDDDKAVEYGLRCLRAAATQKKGVDGTLAREMLAAARRIGRQDLIRQALEFNPAEKAKVDQEERERKDRERKEQERLEKERLEKERLEKERLEKERLEKERQEKERLEKERLEKERQEQERQKRLQEEDRFLLLMM